jgi:hypothetical protein
MLTVLLLIVTVAAIVAIELRYSKRVNDRLTKLEQDFITRLDEFRAWLKRVQ